MSRWDLPDELWKHEDAETDALSNPMRPNAAVEIARTLWAAEGDDIADDELVAILTDVRVRFADRTSILDPQQQAVLLYAVACGELLKVDPGLRNAAVEAFDAMQSLSDFARVFGGVGHAA